MIEITTFFNTVLTTPLGWILNQIYQLVGNYGVSLILFTVLIKLILFPLSIKQQKSTVKMQKLQPLLAEVQNKYKNDQQRQQTEVMKLYKENNINPMGGCLPMLLQFPVLICLYQVICYPLTYMFGKSASESWAIISKYGYDIAIRAKDISPSAAQILSSTKEGLINFKFLGGLLDLSQTPSITNPSFLWIIPIVAALTTFLTTKLTSVNANKKEENSNNEAKRVLNPEAKQNAGNANQAQSMTNTMTYFMPIMTLWIAFSYPAALGFYWFLSNLISAVQQLYLNKIYGAKFRQEVLEIADKKEAEDKIRRRNKQKKK